MARDPTHSRRHCRRRPRPEHVARHSEVLQQDRSLTMSRYTKAISAVLAFLGVLVSSGVLEGDAAKWANVLISAAGAAAVYFLPNVPPKGEPSDPAVSEVG